MNAIFQQLFRLIKIHQKQKLDIVEEDLDITIPHGHKVLDIKTLLEKNQFPLDNKSQWIPLDNSRSGEICLAAKFFPTTKVQQSRQDEEHVENQLNPDKPKKDLL